MHKNKALIAPLGLVGITILSGVFLMSSNSFATDNTDVVDEINITVPVSCSLSGTGMTSHNANIVNGTYQADIGSTTLKAFCNDTNGFAIFAAGYTGDEIGGTNSTKLVNSASAVDNTISTGTATSGNTSNWAMKLATNSSATYAVTLDNGFGAYSAVPSAYTKVAHRDSGTDIGTTATGAELTTTYAAFVNQTQPAGTYVGKVIYTLVHPANEEPPHEVACEAGKICYNANTTTVLGEMGKQSLLQHDWSSCNTYTDNATICVVDGHEIDIDTLPVTGVIDSAVLYASNYKRDGYGFAGWNTKYDYTGINYGPNQDITTPADISANGLSLYAMWIPSQGTLQNWDGCSSMSTGKVTALTDTRDNDTYAVAKLADGKCWTIENLRLDDSAELSSTNTHNPSLPLNNSWYYLNQQGTLTTSNHLSAASNPDSIYSDTAWCTTDSSDCDDQSMLATNNTTLFTNNTSSSYNVSSNVYSYGNYYNWYSATAGHGKHGLSYGSGYVAPGDICPAGWHLPTGKNTSGDFGMLDIALGGIGAYSDSSTNPTGATMSSVYRSYPNNFIYSGFLEKNIARRDSEGDYWTASGVNNEVNNIYSYYMSFSKTFVYPGTRTFSRFDGDAVRCIAGV